MKPRRAGKAGAKSFAARLEKPAAASSIAAELRAGRIDAATAARRLVQDVVTRRVGKHLPPAQRRELEQLLSDVMATDPALSARLARLKRKG